MECSINRTLDDLCPDCPQFANFLPSDEQKMHKLLCRAAFGRVAAWFVLASQRSTRQRIPGTQGTGRQSAGRVCLTCRRAIRQDGRLYKAADNVLLSKPS